MNRFYPLSVGLGQLLLLVIGSSRPNPDGQR